MQTLKLGHGLPSLAEFEQAERDGWVGSMTIVDEAGNHFRLFNYTKRAQYHRVWNSVTSVARGLVVCMETGEIVALPMAKFFNLGEKLKDGSPVLPQDGPFETLVKKDGALGISFRFNRRLCWTSRGSFHSKHGAAAQEIWDRKYRRHEAAFFDRYFHLTPLVEIIHPVTRVVCRYNYEDLVLIAARDRFTGRDLSYAELAEIAEFLGMPLTERIEVADVDAVLALAKTLDDNHEGFVLAWPDHRVKVKGEAYKALHKVLSGITPRILAFGWWDRSLEELLPVMPEEFRDETEELIERLNGRVVELAQEVELLYDQAPRTSSKQEFAAWVQKTIPKPMRGFVLARHEQENPGMADWLSTNTVCELVENGKLGAMLEAEGEAPFAGALADYERCLGDFLWEMTRAPEGIAHLNRLTNLLPVPCHSAFVSAMEWLQPALAVRRLQEHVREQKAKYAGLDLEAMFASAPAADSRYYLHLNWMMAHPMSLRPFLDRWRLCGQRETATNRARFLLSAAFGHGAVADVLTVLAEAFSKSSGSRHAELPAAFAGLRSSFAELWRSLSQSGNPELKMRAAKSLGVHEPRALALLFHSWHGLRTRVRDGYLAEARELRYSARFAEA